MTRTIAVAGKGGTGKTTIAALLVKLLAEKGTVLAIDADPSSNLNIALGVPLYDTVGDVREEMLAAIKSGSFSQGMAKQDYIDLRINEALVEAEGFDLLAMGRGEGPTCYCAANNMLRLCIDRLSGSYDYVVIDNEAGLEHLSRQTTRDVDDLIIVSDPSIRGIVTAGRVKEVLAEVRTRVGRVGLVLNRINGDLPPAIAEAIAERDLELIASIPHDPIVPVLDAQGRPLVELPADSPVVLGVREIARRLGII